MSHVSAQDSDAANEAAPLQAPLALAPGIWPAGAFAELPHTPVILEDGYEADELDAEPVDAASEPALEQEDCTALALAVPGGNGGAPPPPPHQSEELEDSEDGQDGRRVHVELVTTDRTGRSTQTGLGSP